MRDFLDSIVEWSGAEDDWRPVPFWAVASWLAFYTLFLLYAFRMHGGFLFIDFANLVLHEAGHMLFGWFGPTLGLWGGTLLQGLVPLLPAACFFRQRHAAAFVFCVFFFFENWLYTATYMADARNMNLPLVERERLGFRGARLECDLLESRLTAIRHRYCGTGPISQLGRNARVRWLVRMPYGVQQLAAPAEAAVSAASGQGLPSK